ncbi:MAG: phage portal protein, partial [Oscillospiraceae bacterium]|nr:phage portal protein [Oscillospiraceae bacterium]
MYKSCPPWRKVKKGGLYAKGDRNMSLMNVAKVLADEFSNLTFSEQVEITTSVPEYQEYLNRVLQENGFWKNIPDFLSLSYGLGGGILKVYAENGKPRIDYIGGDMFVPTAWNSRGIFEGVFSSITYRNGYYYTLFEWHSFNSNGEASVENILYKSLLKSSLGSPCPLDELFPDLVQSASYNGVNVPMFSYFKPCVSNNADIDCPLGISVFANSLDTLKALDIAFDSFTREFILGKKRIIVPSSCIRTVVDAESGAMKRYFDADDEAFIALKSDETQDLKITDNTVELRVEEHISAINALLNILCFQTGLSAGSLSFDSTQGMKTATEVISQNSKTARTMKGHKNLAKELFENLANSVISLGISLGDIPSGQAYAIT